MRPRLLLASVRLGKLALVTAARVAEPATPAHAVQRVGVAEWRSYFVSVEPAGRKRFRASATTSGQTPPHRPETSPMSCAVTERQRRFVALKSLE